MAQLNNYKKQKTEILLNNIYCHFASTIFEIVAQQHSTLNAVDALHHGRSKKFAMIGGLFRGMRAEPTALKIFCKNNLILGLFGLKLILLKLGIGIGSAKMIKLVA